MSFDWWNEEYGFFGEFYMEGDDSIEGYLAKRHLSLQERTMEDVDGVEKLLSLNGGESILDVPCGYGRHSIELALRGFSVIGSDINSAHLSTARERAKARGIDVVFRKENMLSINYENEFDAVINMCYSFGFFESDAENMQVLENFYSALRGGGKFLMHTDVNLPRVRAGKFKESEFRTLSSGKKLEIEEKFNPSTSRMAGYWKIISPDGKVERRDYSVRVYEKDEFIDMCKQVGFLSCEAFCDWTGRPYSEMEQEIMFVATK